MIHPAAGGFSTTWSFFDDLNARRERAQELVADRARRRGDSLYGHLGAPQNDARTGSRFRYVGEMGAQHVHGYAPKGTGRAAFDQDRRAGRRVARVAVGIAACDDTDPGSAFGLEEATIADNITGH